jgi:GT2 family glycosyltransferase
MLRGAIGLGFPAVPQTTTGKSPAHPTTVAHSLSIVIVAWNEHEALSRTLPPLTEQLAEGDELIVVDNGSTDGTPELVAELAPQARVVSMGENRGFAPAVNAGADAAQGELLLILNPDAMPRPGFSEAIRRPLADARGWGAWMGLVTAEEGRIVNSLGGVVHFTGIAWAGGAGDPVPERLEAGEVPFVSGACLAIPLASWRRLGGFPPEYFLYHEDVDVSLRLRLAGERLGIEPAAVVDHDYEFHRRGQKMRLLERNRWATVLRAYPASVLAVALPGLLATELALIAISIAGGWARLKLAANWDVVRSLPRVLRERRAIQATKRTSGAEFAAQLTPDLDSAYLGRAAHLAPLRWMLRAYWGAARALLRLLSLRSA